MQKRSMSKRRSWKATFSTLKVKDGIVLWITQYFFRKKSRSPRKFTKAHLKIVWKPEGELKCMRSKKYTMCAAITNLFKRNLLKPGWLRSQVKKISYDAHCEIFQSLFLYSDYIFLLFHGCHCLLSNNDKKIRRWHWENKQKVEEIKHNGNGYIVFWNRI